MSAFEMLAFFRFIKFYNEGEITMVSVRKRGKVYEYRFEIATVEGTRKWITKSGYPTKAEAFKEGAKAYNDFYYNGQKTQLRENMSYADFLDYWIDNYASFNLHYSTTISYINIIKNHVKPRVGFYKLWQLDTRLLQEFINKIYVEYGFSKNYMASILKVVKGSLKYACYTLNYINTNPAEHVHAPRIDKIGKDPAHIFTQEEIERILDRFKGTHSIYYAFLTAYYTGMRGTDITSLTVDSIDWEQETINIVQSKTGVDLSLPLTANVGNAIWKYVTSLRPKGQGKEILLSNRRPFEKINGLWGHIKNVFNEAQVRTDGSRTGVRIFRHHLATTLLANEVASPVISSILGHSSPESLNPYIDADIEHLRDCSLSISDYPVRKEVFEL